MIWAGFALMLVGAAMASIVFGVIAFLPCLLIAVGGVLVGADDGPHP